VSTALQRSVKNTAKNVKKALCKSESSESSTANVKSAQNKCVDNSANKKNTAM